MYILIENNADLLSNCSKLFSGNYSNDEPLLPSQLTITDYVYPGGKKIYS